ncbi:MAG TPA: hypothetical protein VJ299_11120 [Steroidobacteraceae bacterium]|jgi:hypothetical protein|nr:hypothetical protein [Steroidobacteraceae bacterium]
MATISTAARNAACDAVVDLIDAGAAAGNLVFRTAGDVEVATLPFSDPAFGAAATGVASASTITSDTNATGGTTTKATLEDSDANAVITATVGTSGSDINLSSTTIGAGDTVSVSSLTVTMPAS